MKNPYKEYLDEFFATLLEYRHATRRLNNVLIKDVEAFDKDNAQLRLGSALVISDWSSKNENGELNFHTGIFKETLKKNYHIEVKKMISRECCLMFAQSFEALERYFKDCLFNKASREKDLKNFISSLHKPDYKFKRESMPGGDKLFKVLKRAGGKTFAKFSKRNNPDIKFSEFWTVISEARHSITHSQSIIKESKVNYSPYHSQIFLVLFNHFEVDDNLKLISLDFEKFNRLIDRISEFAFQVYKVLSIEEQIKWDIYK